MKEIFAPTFCPSCEGLLKWEKELLYCRNPDCGSQVAKKIENFAKVLKIKGLGKATIEKLELRSVNDIYELTLEEVEEVIRGWCVLADAYPPLKLKQKPRKSCCGMGIPQRILLPPTSTIL